MASPRKMKALTLQILRSTFLLQLRLLDRDHVTRLLLQTPCGFCNFNLTLLFLCIFLLHLFFFPPLPPPPIPPALPLPTMWCSRQKDKHRETQTVMMPAGFRPKRAGCRSEHAGRPCAAKIAAYHKKCDQVGCSECFIIRSG